MKQNVLSLRLNPLASEPVYVRLQNQRDFTAHLKHPRGPIPPGKLFADLLKRQARTAMSNLTECPPDTIPAHLAALDMLRDIFRHVVRHDFAETPESRLSGSQLLFAATLADFLACIEITRKSHRMPSFLNCRDSEISEINRKLDTLSGLFAGSRALNQVLAEDAQNEMELAR